MPITKPVEWFSFLSKTLENNYPKDVSHKNYSEIHLDYQVLVSITAKLSCKLGKQMSYEKVSKTFQRALRSGAYQLFRHLTVGPISTNLFTSGSAKINIIKKSAIYITGSNKKFRIKRTINAHFRVKDAINCLAAVFCRFPNLNYLQISESNQIELKNCMERAMQLANCDKLAFKTLDLAISEILNNRICYEALPVFADSLTELDICNIPPFDVNSAALLIRSLKELNLRTVKILIRGFSVPRNNWLAQAFGHMDKLRYLAITSVGSSYSFIFNRENMRVVSKLKHFHLILYKMRNDEIIESFTRLSNQVPNTTKLSLVFGLTACKSKNFKIKPIKLISDIKLALRLSSANPNLKMYICIAAIGEIKATGEENLKKIIIDAFETIKNETEFAAIWLPKFTLMQANVAKPRCVCVEFKCGAASGWLQFELCFSDLCFAAEL